MFKFIDKKLDAVFANDEDPLNKVRAQFLVNGLLISFFIILITLPQFFFNSATSLLFVRSSIMAIFQIGLIWVLLNTSKWKLVAHFTCIIVAILIWSNIFVNVQGVKIISLQWMLLLIVMSYYLLGTKWGIFYSTISLIFMLTYFALFGPGAMTAVSNNYVNDFAFITVFAFNFLLIIYLQYHFFNAFNQTIQRLKIKQIEEKLLNEKLKEAIIASEESSKAKTYFLSTISHELRTPLNGVIGMTNVLILDNPREDQQENLSMLKFSANNLLSLINDVLDINKIESGKIEIEKIPFKIHDLIKNIHAGFKIKADEKGLGLELIADENLTDIAIVGDPTRLTQILVNLTENALKFTTVGKVTIQISVLEKTKTDIKLFFSIKDSGIGIPKDKQTLVFESFSQASTSTTRKYGGTGLGLAIVKNLLELHNSKIIVESEVGSGTSFSFEIEYKLHDFYIDEKQYKGTEHMDISNLKILVAEDNQMNILLMKKLLAKWNIVPDFAGNGSEAFEAFKSNDYDLILMDIHMPIMDGYESTHLIRSYADTNRANVRIIALTASVALDVRTKIKEAGINDYISKPFNPEELRTKLEDIALIKN
jgi:signal transduction histidine kinase/ActR/RegA family two-component response regulator